MKKLDTEQRPYEQGAVSGAPDATEYRDSETSRRLQVQGVRLGYDRKPVIDSLDLSFEPGKFTAIIGPNGCGKSTLLSAMARLLKPSAGQILLGGVALDAFKPKAYAREVSLLSQQAVAPSGITVAQLVSRGRFPHQGLLAQHSSGDEAAVHQALMSTGILELATRRLSELSGGQRQRVWVATTLAQQAPIMLLDEPTTYLDVAHQVDLLDLFASQRDAGKTVIAVLHDINQAMRYADRVVLMHEGKVLASGAPDEVITGGSLEAAFGVRCEIHPDPVTGGPMMVTVPASRRIF
ncbi:ABC transporter ATP-binding protein [Glutamicibacter sp. JL.03c]|uniref:ABC transporter ATP-binding protein n=1 Tax=Glutamicibacter sp. JL.03c TaxID=2984842 RepID=UPI0021F71D18|nr:ABC transporter ATP-binding protein [Glutamicibacter sp. JL.03c]UYQ78759.1 ABC transporter ATP-binding protein [Glutamicibacter sp. JL.03c]